MQPTKKDWNNLDQYLDIFNSITEKFITDLDSEKAGKLETHLEQRPLSENGIELEQCVDELKDNIIPQLSAARGSRFWAFVTGGATPIATLADWLVTTFDQNVHKDGDSVATKVERQAIRWMCELFDLPNSFDGIMTTGGTGCNFLGATCARQFAGNKQGIDVAKEGVYNLDIEIFSTSPHSSMIKSLGMSGLGQKQFTLVNAIKGTEMMDVAHLELLMGESDAKAKVVIASAGTVTATDFDDLSAITTICKTEGAWLHVDGAFGLFERLVNGTEGYTKDIELADSITVDCHKWLNVPYDCGVFLTRHSYLLEESFDVPARYLANETGIADFMSLGVENSRRFRALPVWLTLLAYGKSGVRQWVENDINITKLLADWIDKSNDFELLYPCKLNVILFRPNCNELSDEEADAKTIRLMNNINQDGRLFISPGHWQGQEVIRVALSNWQTDESDIQVAIDVLSSLKE